MFALHVQLFRHLVAIIGKKIVIQGFVVASNTSSDTRCVCREYRCDLWQMIVDIQQSQSSHPLITMIDYLFGVVKIKLIETLNHKGSSIREHRCFVIVSVCMKAIHLIVLPQLTVDLVFLGEIWHEINHDGNRFTRDSPSTHLYVETFFQGFFLPVFKQLAIFSEVRALFLSPTIGPDKDDAILQCILQRFCPSR